jgi:hypothetical protein
MPIITSTYTLDDQPQADGRCYVHEIHTDHRGRIYTAEYLAPAEWDYEHTLATRAANIGAEIDRREAAELEAANFQLPVSKWDFLQRLTPTEVVACLALRDTDPQARYALYVLENVPDITLGNPVVAELLTYFESQGCFAPGRVQEILNGA